MRTYLTLMAPLLLSLATVSLANDPSSDASTYQIWDDKPAPNRGADYSRTTAKGYPYDKDWESYSYPIGNGYMGANIFGRTDTERVQLTDKTLTSGLPYKVGGLTNFAELYLNFDHHQVSQYQRGLNLNQAIASVSYQYKGVNFHREYLANYPSNVLAIKLTADKPGAINFSLDLVAPYLRADLKRARISKQNPSELPKHVQFESSDNKVIMSGSVAAFSLNYEAQVQVMTEGGKVFSTPNNQRSKLRVEDADSATILLALGTNYQLDSAIFLAKENHDKLDPTITPHQAITQRMEKAKTAGFDALKREHQQDYQQLFGRVALQLSEAKSDIPTETLVNRYQADPAEYRYLEELMFHFGRYLLIASSRPNTLPSTLQGVWSQYHSSPWSGGYWHNINVQMNYWGAFNTNLAETFDAYDSYHLAYLPRARQHAKAYIKRFYPDIYQGDKHDYGWIIGLHADAYYIGTAKANGSSGLGTGGFTTKLLWEKYAFTQDKAYLRNVAYPALYELSLFLSKTLIEQDGLYLVKYSASPEQQINGKNYVTTGTTFDQGFVWETYTDLLNAADILGIKDDPLLETIKEQVGHLDPVSVGESGQIKEYREERYYGEIADPKHRHISHLCTIYPGSYITSARPDWIAATDTTLDLRGIHKTTGWAMAHRMAVRARTKNGDKAHYAYQRFLMDRTMPNLWTKHPPFQIDGNLGTMAGVAEMLLQSHEGYIEVLPALPKAWQNGHYRGLVARGNIEVDALWRNGRVRQLDLYSKSGTPVRIKYRGIEGANVFDAAGKAVPFRQLAGGLIEFDTDIGAKYQIK